MNLKDNLSNILQEAQKMQERMQETQKELEAIKSVGTAGGNLVKVELEGRHAKTCTLDASLFDSDLYGVDEKEVIEDLIVAAVNSALEAFEKKSKEHIGQLTSGFQLPTDLLGDKKDEE